MEINRIAGGIEYRPEISSLVLPGDKDYRVRSGRTSATINAPSTLSIIDSSNYLRVEMPDQRAALANRNSLALLRQLGEMEAEGTTFNYPGMDVVDEYAGGHCGVIDIWV